jgi:hypothetical protein
MSSMERPETAMEVESLITKDISDVAEEDAPQRLKDQDLRRRNLADEVAWTEERARSDRLLQRRGAGRARPRGVP